MHPKIFTPSTPNEPIPPEFNSVYLALDGRLNSSLEWSRQRQQAMQYAEQGLHLFWYLDLGIFSSLEWPMTDESQFQAFVLSLEHFRNTLWKEFKETTIGLSLYRGSGDFSLGYPWDELQENNYRTWRQTHQVEDQPFFKRLFCCEAAGEYLELLAKTMPDELALFALVDLRSFTDPLEAARHFSKERFERIHLALNQLEGGPLPAYAWNSGSASLGFIGHTPLPLIKEEVKTAICLPSIELVHPSHYIGLKEAFSQQEPYKVIPEAHLITEWDGLDTILYAPTGLSGQGKRKLQGFCAAGGAIISTL